MIKIPRIMISQHPDHAQVPYWCKSAFISTRQEVEECYRSFAELDADEYLWDWEGKLVDEAMMERLLQSYFSFFQGKQLGRDVFVTFRLPQPNAHRDYRIGRALFALKTAESLSRSLKLHTPPLVEVILPLVESGEEMLRIHQAYQALGSLNHSLFNLYPEQVGQIGVIPIFEKVETLFRAGQILKDYIASYKKEYGNLPLYLRPFSARSDPALNNGLIPAVIANKIALKQYYQLAQEKGVPVYPIIGPGTLPFRGHLTPTRIREFGQEYPGIHTVVVQGSFRYDWNLREVKRAINLIKKLKSDSFGAIDIDAKLAWRLCEICSQPYQATVEKLAEEVNWVASHLPARRERMLHIGLFGYSRGVGKVTLPRAISFTASLYSLGAPPEIIGTGRAIREIMKKGRMKDLKRFYSYLDEDLSVAMAFYCESAVKRLSRINPAWEDVITDAHIIQEFLKAEGQYIIQEQHSQIAEQIVSQLHQNNGDCVSLTKLLEEAAIIRHSLG